MPFSNSVSLNNQTAQRACKGFSSSFDYVSSISLVQPMKISSLKQTNCKMYMHCTVPCSTRNRAQLVKRQQRKRTSQESEMVTYKHVNEVGRNICVKHQAKRIDSRAIILLIATFVGALKILIIKQTNTNVANQTNKLNK